MGGELAEQYTRTAWSTAVATRAKILRRFLRNNFPRGLWSDGTTLWSPSDRDDARLYAYDLATRQHDPASYRSNYHILDPANANPQGLWSDGTTLWVNDSDPA